jgi:hypothetical protein
VREGSQLPSLGPHPLKLKVENLKAKVENLKAKPKEWEPEQKHGQMHTGPELGQSYAYLIKMLWFTPIKQSNAEKLHYFHLFLRQFPHRVFAFGPNMLF